MIKIRSSNKSNVKISYHLIILSMIKSIIILKYRTSSISKRPQPFDSDRNHHTNHVTQILSPPFNPFIPRILSRASLPSHPIDISNSLIRRSRRANLVRNINLIVFSHWTSGTSKRGIRISESGGCPVRSKTVNHPPITGRWCFIRPSVSRSADCEGEREGRGGGWRRARVTNQSHRSARIPTAVDPLDEDAGTRAATSSLNVCTKYIYIYICI